MSADLPEAAPARSSDDFSKDVYVNRQILPRIARRTDTRILFLVLDGLGGVIGREPTALQRSRHPNLDRLASESALGRTVHVAEGITPGSGPGHFALFGYDPLETEIGRGVLEAMGLGVEVRPGDVAVRGNFCTLDAAGRLADRRAGRIATEEAAPLVRALQDAPAPAPGVEVGVHQGLQHRFALVLRGAGLGDAVADTDPQQTGVEPLPARATDPSGRRTAEVANAWVARARAALRSRTTANGVLLRGFSTRPALPTLCERASLRPIAIAAYPAYRGVARILGMDIAPGVGPKSTVAEEVDALERAWGPDHDFYFLHVKGTDSAGEDGDEERKARVIEAVDAEVPRLRALAPDVIVVTGDHSTPGPLAAHSWHPTPFLLHGPWCEPDGMPTFDEVHCQRGRFGGAYPAVRLLRQALANAGKLEKFGA
jgi:2,3-bisphosphoglycerate-independent phosphoglycerate mutase